MANKEIYQFTPNNNIQPSDLVPFSNETLPGHESSISTFSSFVEKVKDQISNSSSNVYVSPAFGNDSPGNGTYLNPYATLDFAISQITPSVTEPVNLVLTSEIYSVSNLVLKPFVYFVGNNSTINVSNSISLSSEWGVNYGSTLNFYCSKCYFVCSNPVTLNFNSYPQNQNHYLSFDDIFFSNNFSINGNSKQFISFNKFLNTSFNCAFTNISNFDFYNSEFSNLSISNITNTSGTIGNISSCSILGQLTLVANLTNSLETLLKGTFLPNSPQIDGETCIFYSDCNITSVPTLINNGIWVPLSIASGVVMQYTPINYTYPEASVDGYFEGVDTKFGQVDAEISGAAYTARVNSTSSVSLSTPVPHQVYVNMVSTGQFLKLPQVNNGSSLVNVGQKIYIEVSLSSESFALQYYDGTLLVNLVAGESVTMVLDANTTPQGVWIPEYFVRSVNGLNGQAEITGLNAPADYTPTNYTPVSPYITGHLEGINSALPGALPPGTSSFANASYNSSYASAGTIGFSDTTTYLPFIQFTSPATYIFNNNFEVTDDGNLHTIFRCKKPGGGVFDFKLSVLARLVNYNSQQPFFINISKNGFSAVNIDVTRDIQFILYDTTEQSQKLQTYFFKMAMDYDDYVYLPVIRSALSTSPFDTLLKPFNWQVDVSLDGESNSTDFPLTIVNTTSSTLSVNSRYLCNNSGVTTLTLPTVASVGSLIRIDGVGSGGFRIAQNAGQSISLLNVTSTTGATGYVDSVDSNSGLLLQCAVANTQFVITQPNGNFNLV